MLCITLLPNSLSLTLISAWSGCLVFVCSGSAVNSSASLPVILTWRGLAFNKWSLLRKHQSSWIWVNVHSKPPGLIICARRRFERANSKCIWHFILQLYFRTAPQLSAYTGFHYLVAIIIDLFDIHYLTVHVSIRQIPIQLLWSLPLWAVYLRHLYFPSSLVTKNAWTSNLLSSVMESVLRWGFLMCFQVGSSIGLPRSSEAVSEITCY